jgi:hypothetical protein
MSDDEVKDPKQGIKPWQSAVWTNNCHDCINIELSSVIVATDSRQKTCEKPARWRLKIDRRTKGRRGVKHGQNLQKKQWEIVTSRLLTITNHSPPKRNR